MSLSLRLSTLKASQLKYAAFLMGLPSSGTKLQLESATRQRISMPLSSQEDGRVVSVDMGIKNLGICVLEVPQLMTQKYGETSSIKVVEWTRIDVLNHGMLLTRDSHSDAASRRKMKLPTRPVLDPTAFKPSNLSKIAVQVAEELLHTYKPNHILIERQRFRSGGASAVQEWTLRVNMLESMLWATFETLRRKSGHPNLFPETHEVDPARVARFWCARPAGYETRASDGLLPELPEEKRTPGGLTNRESKRTVDKKEKIALVRSWLSDKHMDSTANVALDLSAEVQGVANAFLSGNGKPKRRSNALASPLGSEADKLDDLADCLLQGVAWVRWIENQNKISEMFVEET